MAKYISRQAVLNLPQSITRNFMGEVVERSIDVEDIKDLPAADVVPVIHARWNQLDNGGFVCSACMGGYKAQPTRMGKPMFEYCPICGAKMDGGE